MGGGASPGRTATVEAARTLPSVSLKRLQQNVWFLRNGCLSGRVRGTCGLPDVAEPHLAALVTWDEVAGSYDSATVEGRRCLIPALKDCSSTVYN